MDETSLLVILAFIVIIVALFLIRFRTSAGADVSLFNWIRLRIWGTNAPPENAPEENVRPSPPAVVGGDYVGRDKVTVLQQPHPPQVTPPSPSLRLALVDRQGGYVDDLSVQLHATALPHDAVFRFALMNDQVGSASKGLVARLEVHWRGDAPQHTIKLAPFARPDGWKIESAHITSDKPIILTFTSPDILAMPAHPHEWSSVRVTVPERIDGHLLIAYTLSSYEPHLDFKGQIRVHLEYI